jgi:hypothetical protein
MILMGGWSIFEEPLSGVLEELVFGVGAPKTNETVARISRAVH